MTTTIFFHAATSVVVGTLPATEQSALTAADNMDPVTTNRSMNITKGTLQTSVSKSLALTPALKNFYCTRWVSDPLDSGSTSISANTWTVSVGCSAANISQNAFPGNGSAPGGTQCCLYVWRPSTGTKVGNVFDRQSSTGGTAGSTTSETSNVFTFVGSAVTGTVGDVLIFEFWAVTQSDTSNVSALCTLFFDGTNQENTANVANSSIASYVSTPQTLTFAIPPIDCTVTGVTLTNKFIFVH
jgi:hypothetical protein